MHVIIWAVPRVGSTALALALGALNEPFQLPDYGRSDGFRSANEIVKTCLSRRSLKHLYEQCPDSKNVALAIAADRNGYRHIRLVRCNEFGRLVSRDIAFQQDAWQPRTAAFRFAQLKKGSSELHSLDIPNLLRMHRASLAKWNIIRAHITGPILRVRFEDIASISASLRRAEFRRIASFLRLSPAWIEKAERTMARGAQHTEEVWQFVPNTNELRQALLAEGAL
jgi:hypothetical protein